MKKGWWAKWQEKSENRIRSIQDTMKITRAMYMMSSMKLRKAKQQLEDTEPYFFGLQEQISSILYHFPDMEHIYFDNRSKDQHEVVKKKAFIVLTGDKGMAGAYNHNVIKEAQRLCDESDEYKLYVVGDSDNMFLCFLHSIRACAFSNISFDIIDLCVYENKRSKSVLQNSCTTKKVL